MRILCMLRLPFDLGVCLGAEAVARLIVAVELPELEDTRAHAHTHTFVRLAGACVGRKHAH